jgi:hypothetical protein
MGSQATKIGSGHPRDQLQAPKPRWMLVWIARQGLVQRRDGLPGVPGPAFVAHCAV